jgi:hypothetical protein
LGSLTFERLGPELDGYFGFWERAGLPRAGALPDVLPTRLILSFLNSREETNKWLSNRFSACFPVIWP